VDVVNDYGLALSPEVREEPESRSDHYAFWRYGFPAVLAIEDMEDFNKNYHSQNDLLANLDLDYLTNFVKAAVGAVAHAACLAPSYNFYLPVVEINGIPR
jgi:Zn-dependent M28 family amino/carboxypeptidase